jgi:hypothetical protein
LRVLEKLGKTRIFLTNTTACAAFATKKAGQSLKLA